LFSRRNLGSTLTAGIRAQVVAPDATLLDDFAFASAACCRCATQLAGRDFPRGNLARVIADRLS
jgi:hypothetical protein